MGANAVTVTQASGWIDGISGTVQVSGPVQVSGTVTAGAASGTVTVNGTVSVSNAVSADISRLPVVIFVSNTVAVPTDSTILFTVHTGGTAVTAGAAFWVVPAGKTFRINSMYLVAKTSAVLSQAQFAVLLGTAAASMSVTSTVGVAAVMPYALPSVAQQFAMGGFNNDVAAATTIALGAMGGTSHTILGAAIEGYLF